MRKPVKLFLLVVAMAVLVIGLGVLGVQSLKRMNATAHTLHADRLLALQELAEIRYNYEAGILSIAEQLEHSSAPYRQAAAQLDSVQAAINTNWNLYLHTRLTGEEDQLAQQAASLKTAADQAVASLATRIRQADKQLTGDQVDEDVRAAISPLLNKLRDLSLLQIRVSNELNRQNQELYKHTVNRFLLLTGGALVLLVFLALFFFASIRKLIGNLQASNQQLQEEKERSDAFFRYAGDGILLLGQDLQILDCNERACDLLGYSREELCRFHLEALVPAAERTDLLQRKAFIRSIGGSMHERRFCRRDGSLLETEVNVRWMDQLGYITILRDISGRKQAEIQLRESVEKYRYLFDNNPAYIIIWDLQDLRVLEVNGEILRKYGYSREEWDHMTVLDYRPASDHAGIREFARTMLRGQEPVRRRTWTHLKKNGEAMIMEISSHRIVYNNRPAILSLAMDVTDQVKAQHALQKKDALFRSLIDHAADAIFFVNNEGVIFDANRCATELLGYRKEEFIGMSVLQLHPPEARVNIRRLWDALRQNKSLTDERYFVRKDGSLVMVEISRRMLPDNSGAIAILRDITERKRMEAALEEQKEQLTLFIEHSPASLAMLDRDLRYIATSRRWKTDYRLGEADLVGKSHYEVFPDIPDRWKAIHRRCLQGAVERCEEDAFVRSDGTIDWLRWEIRPWHNVAGEVGGIIMFTEVITESKRISELFRHQFEHSPDTILLVSRNLLIESINRNRSGQWTREQLIGKSCIDILPEQAREPARKAILRCLETESIQELEHSLYQGRWFRSRFVPIRIGNMVQHVMIIGTDITDRKAAEDQLRESEERNRALVENISDGIILLDEDLQTIYRSPSVLRITGFEAEEMKGRTILDLTYPEDLYLCLDYLEKARSLPGIAVHGQFRILHKRQGFIWVEGTLSNQLANPSIRAYIINYRDISERKQLEEQQLLMASIVNSSDDAIISKDLDLNITSWNKGAEKILGYTPGEIIGKSIFTVIPPELHFEEAEILSHIRQGRSVDHFETRRIRKDGTIIHVSITISPIRNAAGQIIGASKILRDITDQVRSEQRIKQSEANYRQLFEGSPAPMWVLEEATGRFLQVNQAAIRNYGYSEQEFLSMHLDQLVRFVQEPFRQTSGAGHPGGHRHVKKNGEEIDVVTSSLPVVLNESRQILMIALDVTEQNLYEQKLTRAAIKVQEEERYEIGGELHDNVCQILASSIIYLSMLKKSLPESALKWYDQTHEFINLATQEIRNLSHQLAPAFFDDARLEDAFQHLLKSFNAEQRYDIRLHFSGNTRAYCLGKDQQLNLYRILQEQLRNIQKHARATLIDIQVGIRDQALEMRIRDNGVGFDPGKTKGGIGLANMNRRVRLFGGNLQIHSRPGQGCELRVEIPLQVPA